MCAATQRFPSQGPILARVHHNHEEGKMKLRTLGMILTATAALSAASVFAGDADFTMVNRTGYDIREIYISPANKDDWGKDRMGANGTLDNNKQRLFKFRDTASCKQDIKAVFDEGDTEVTWSDLDLCEINKLTLKYNRATRTVSAIKE
jgi:hypothetical protein